MDDNVKLACTCSISFNQKYIREKRWDVISHCFQNWAKNAEEKFGSEVNEPIMRYIKTLDFDSLLLDGQVNHIRFNIDDEMNIWYDCFQYGNIME